MKANIQIKLAVIAFALLSASFVVPAYAIPVFGANVTASLRVTDIRDDNGTELTINQAATVFGAAAPGQAFASAISVGLVFSDPATSFGNAISTDTATFAGTTATGQTLAGASAISTGLIFIDNATTVDLTVSFILDFSFSGFASSDPLAGEFALSGIAIRVLGPDEFGTPAAEDLIDPIFADTSMLNPFEGSGSVPFDAFVPSPFNDPFLSFQPILFQTEAFGLAQVTEPGIFVLFGMGLLALIGLHAAKSSSPRYNCCFTSGRG